MIRTTIFFFILAFSFGKARSAQPQGDTSGKVRSAYKRTQTFSEDARFAAHYRMNMRPQVCTNDSLPPEDAKPAVSKVNPSSMLSVVFGTFALMVGIDAGLTALGFFLVPLGLAAVAIGIRYLKKDKNPKFSKEGLAAAGFNRTAFLSMLAGGAAVIALIVLGETAFLFPFFAGIMALVLGIASLKKKEGKAMKILGIILGGIAVSATLPLAYNVAGFLLRLIFGLV